MIVFAEKNIVKISHQELTNQGFKVQGWGTAIEKYSNGKETLYFHSGKKVFFKNGIEETKPNFKVIVAGSRDFIDYEFLKRKLEFILQNRTNIEIVSGACSTGKLTFTRPDGTKVYGADGLGEKYAAEKGLPVASFAADWDGLGRKAGHVRNKEMAVYAAPGGGCIVFRRNMSPGSTSMAEYAEQNSLKVKVYDVN